MPGMDGLQLCRAVRAAASGRYVYFILLTSCDRTQDTIDGLNAGADDYVTKPFHPGELIMRVNTGRRIIRAESSGLTIFALAKLAEFARPGNRRAFRARSQLLPFDYATSTEQWKFC